MGHIGDERARRQGGANGSEGQGGDRDSEAETEIFLAYAELVTGRPEVDSHNRMELTEDERLTGNGRGMAE